jgi:hypothetical protein
MIRIYKYNKRFFLVIGETRYRLTKAQVEQMRNTLNKNLTIDISYSWED